MGQGKGETGKNRKQTYGNATVVVPGHRRCQRATASKCWDEQGKKRRYKHVSGLRKKFRYKAFE